MFRTLIYLQFYIDAKFRSARRVSLKSDGTTGQTTGHLAARGSASRYMARRKTTRRRLN